MEASTFLIGFIAGVSGTLLMSAVIAGGRADKRTYSDLSGETRKVIYNQGHTDGFKRGKHMGYDEGYWDGHTDGRVAEKADSSNRQP